MNFYDLCNIILEQKYYGPVYHGGKWDGQNTLKMGRGSLGYGAYFTPSIDIAKQYAYENNGHISTVLLDIKNPLVIKIYREDYIHPCVSALIKLGMEKTKASNLVEKIEEQKGYLGKEISSRAIQQGYDCIFQYFNDDLREIVIWDSNRIIKYDER